MLKSLCVLLILNSTCNFFPLASAISVNGKATLLPEHSLGAPVTLPAGPSVWYPCTFTRLAHTNGKMHLICFSFVNFLLVGSETLKNLVSEFEYSN